MLSSGSRVLSPVGLIAAALLLSSCGGSMGDSVTGPSPIDMPGDSSGLRAANVQLDDLDLGELGADEVDWSADDPEGLSASCRGKVLLCHKGRRSLWVPRWAVRGHQRHGDQLGKCDAPPPQATCPCFSRSDIESAAAGCSNLNASCPATFSLGLFCSPGGSGGTVGNLGYWEAVVGQDTCSWTEWDPLTGDAVTQTLPVTTAEFEACRSAITSSSPYPSSCPQ